MFRKVIAVVGLLFITVNISYADTCSAEDFTVSVSGESECLAMRRFGNPEPDTLIVWLHGDVSSGGPANYHFSAAEGVAKRLSDKKVMSVALVRPGYPDGFGNQSSVADSQSGRLDHYTKENLNEVGVAIERLQTKFRPKKTFIVGHSGGAATAAVLLGLKPNLVDGAVLVACPCDLVAWRTGRRAWQRSEDPLLWADKVSATSRVIAITGGRDDNTGPVLAQTYVNLLVTRKVAAEFRLLPYETHNSAFASREVVKAVTDLVEGK